ncbi:2,3,4,5-tetrahydropyridine-2,6-dicarboxylate N-acetyltransferase [Pseudomonas fluorescens]|uniref:DapH/DapD/GlmU-related protein n=1 Tax=Pseudomonas fluorescens TaxID=294 RepID=UPI00124205D4|nr:DapH/DapD/GlmU-related protein [Pseudomonas fluorescens]VVQ02165.1 2,3,4,5-tetrahydropyridine-2,6-dicarboxylate N-acetyltransferase [Pseudomonas fluorescens]
MSIRKLLSALLSRIRGELTTKAYINTGMRVGKNFQRMQNCTMDISHCWLIEIGDNVTFAPNVKLIAHDASTINITGYAKIDRISIGNNCFIGNSSIILPGVRIGNNCVIGSGSVVTKSIPDNTVVAGNPARILCDYDQYCTKIKNEFIHAPLFDKDYTIHGKISDTKKTEMKDALSDNFGFCK